MRILESGYKIRSPRFEELTLLSRIEKSAASLFLDTPYSFLVNAEPLPLDFVRERLLLTRQNHSLLNYNYLAEARSSLAWLIGENRHQH